jgi:DNA-binding GntR family transcriptional regulator
MRTDLAARPTHRDTIAERVAMLLRENILAGAVKCGAPLREEELAKQFDISRHVVREVLRLLASDGLVDYSSFRGSRVVHLSPTDVHEISTARRFIELNTVRSAAKFDGALIARLHQDFARAVERKEWREAFDLDLAFHAAIVSAGDNPLVSEWHRALVQRLRLAHLVAPAFQEEGLVASVPQHAEIALAAAAGDSTHLAQALESHLLNAEHQLSERIA